MIIDQSICINQNNIITAILLPINFNTFIKSGDNNESNDTLYNMIIIVNINNIFNILLQLTPLISCLHDLKI